MNRQLCKMLFFSFGLCLAGLFSACRGCVLYIGTYKITNQTFYSMKKLLLALFTAVLAVTASAQTVVTFVAGTDKTNVTDSNKPDEITKDGITISFSLGNFGNAQYRCYKGATMTVTSSIGNIASVEIVSTANAGKNYGPDLFSTTAGTYTYEGKNGTWTGDAESVVLTTSGQVRMSQIVITTAAAEGTVAKPTVKPAGGTYYGDLEVSMTVADGCTAKYTVNDAGYEDTYDETITLEAPGTYTVKAYAVDATGKKSDVVETTYELKEIVNYTSIADLRANCTATSQSTAAVVTFSFENLLVTGVSGSNVFVTDGSNSYVLYAANTLKKGDMISGKVAGKLYQYNGLGELSVTDSFADVTVVSSGNEVAAKTIAIDDAVSSYDTYEASYVKFANVTFQADKIGTTYGQSDYRAVAIEDEAGDQINIYDQFNVLTETTFYTTKKYDVCCYVVNYKGTKQVYVLDASDVKVLTDLKTPNFKWIAREVTVYMGDKVPMALTNDSDGEVVYSSSDATVATIDADGNITLVGAGKCDIVAAVPETENYLAATATFTLTVMEKTGGIETFANGGFEEWKSDSEPTGWKSTTTASNATLSKSTDAHSGDYSVCVKNTSSNSRLASKEYLLEAGWYTMQFYAKSVADAENKATTCPGYAPWDSEKNKMGTYVYGAYANDLSSTEWTLVTFTFQLEEKTQINLVAMNPKSTDTVKHGNLLVDDFKFRAATENEIVATGISSVKAETEDGAIYNVAGQKVNADYRGIVIKNGKKYLKK